MRDGDDDGCAALVDYKYHPMVADAQPVIVAALQAFDVTRTIRPVRELLHFGEDVLPLALVRNPAKLPHCLG